MHKTVRLLLLIGAAIGMTTAAHAQALNTNNHNRSKAVFVMTNDADQNSVIAFQRNQDGTLERRGKFFTGGRGSGGTTDPLASQGSLTLSDDGSLLFAMNAGSGNLSVFRVVNSSLWLVDWPQRSVFMYRKCIKL
jgi:6-phosphogluconolactonase (cycloisomerase 2 family)